MFVRNVIRLVFVVAAAMGSTIASGVDFRVSTRVYVGQSVRPASENTTLFVGDLVYDFMETGSHEVTVYDAATGDFDLIDLERKVRTSVGSEALRRFTAELKVRAAANGGLDPVVRFAADPQFDEFYDVTNRELVLRSPAMTYRANGMAVAEDQARKYHRFCDWFCRLNATTPGALPPFARLRLNESLAEQGIVAREIRLTLAARQAGGSKTVLRSEHKFSGELTNDARERITTTRVQLAEFTSIPFHEYRGLKLQASRPSARR
jgi:hypothetical protein